MTSKKILLSKSALIYSVFLGILVVLFFTSNSHAATLTNASNTITTSRPSASSPLSSDVTSTDENVSIFDNGSFFLASDSAQIIKTTDGSIQDSGTTVSSQSAGLDTVYFAEQVGNAASAGVDVLMTPVTAMHHIQFDLPQTIPNTGDIVLNYPALQSGDANNEASPSATTFQFNDLDANASSLIQVVDDGSDITSNTTISASNPSAGSSPSITITVDTGTIDAGSTVDIFIGCSAISGGDCSTESPTIINPTKSSNAGTADIWKIEAQTKDGSDNDLDNATIAVGTIESVTVRATVDPTLNFSITEIDDGSAVNSGNTTGCSQTETTNAGVDSSATEVNLGLLTNTPNTTDAPVGNMAAQRINITTNGANGYTLTATSSGSLINPATGFEIADSTTPTAFPQNEDWFGFHPCGLDVDDSTWNSTANNACNTYISGSTDPVCLYAWPTETSNISLASDTTGPIGPSVEAGNGIVSVSYAAGVDSLVPPGEYRTVVTYVATPAF